MHFKPFVFLRIVLVGSNTYICVHFTDSGGGGCFPSVARVQLEHGKSILMSELQTGDRVQTGRDFFVKVLFHCHYLEYNGDFASHFSLFCAL